MLLLLSLTRHFSRLQSKCRFLKRSLHGAASKFSEIPIVLIAAAVTALGRARGKGLVHTFTLDAVFVLAQLGDCLFRCQRDTLVGPTRHWIARSRVLDEQVRGADRVGHDEWLILFCLGGSGVSVFDKVPGTLCVWWG